MGKNSHDTDIEIVNYDTEYLDALDGSVTDIVPTATHTAITRPTRANLVLPTPNQTTVIQGGSGMGEMMAASGQIVGTLMSHDPHGQTVQNDNAITHAKASLLYSGAHIVAFLVVIVAVMMLAYPVVGGNFRTYATVGMLLFGLAGFGALLWNRHQGLHHSATGIAHADIQSRERVAIHLIDRQFDVVEKATERIYGGKRNV